MNERFIALLEACIVAAGATVTTSASLNWNDRVIGLLEELGTAIGAIAPPTATESVAGTVTLAKGGQESITDSKVVKSKDVRLLMSILFTL